MRTLGSVLALSVLATFGCKKVDDPRLPPAPPPAEVQNADVPCRDYTTTRATAMLEPVQITCPHPAQTLTVVGGTLNTTYVCNCPHRL